MAKAKATKKPTRKKPGAEEGPKGVEMDFKIDDLTWAPELQPRTGDGKSGHGIHGEHVAELQRAVHSRTTLPRVRVWRVAGLGNFITDGHHTTKAYAAEGRKSVPAIVFEGTWLDAVKDSSGEFCNPQKALTLSYDDKRNKVRNLLKALADAGENWSNGRIAKHCDVSDDLVATVLEKSGIKKPGTPVKGADGRTYKDKAGKGRAKKSAVPVAAAEPSAPVVPPVLPGHPPVPATPPPPPPPPPVEAALTFDFAAFEGHVGVVDRDIDKLAGMFKALHSPRSEGIRRLLRDFKAAFGEWHRELGEKARAR